jgi:uroporphyrin-III C-methyltransferase/precorrin-2 dehydrogenase/sirohydrochlorin ferrochelatase
VDRPALSDFSSGSAVRRGALSIGISTGGAAPAFGQALRRRIEALIPDGAGAYLPAADNLRARVKAKFEGAPRRRFWADAADAAFDLMQGGDAPKTEKAWAAWMQQRLDGAGAEPAKLIVIAAPKSVDDVTLGQARALSRADVAFIAAGAEQACLSLLRRDAEQRAVKDLAEAQGAAQVLAPGQLAVALVPPVSSQ